jgi:hypothetical protein
MKKFTLFVLALLTLSTIGAKAETAATPELPEGVITCAEAVAICEQTGETSTTDKYTIRGYVTEVKEAYNSKYGNATYWMADEKGGSNQLQAYRVKPVNTSDQAVKLHDYVEVVGTLVNYYGNTPEVNAGGTYTIITAAEGGETPEEPTLPEGLVGEGTEENPFTIEDVIALNNEFKGPYYVKAYIVGHALGQAFAEGLDIEAPFEAEAGKTQGTNIAVASSMTAEVANIIPVQLPAGELRNAFNLVENPNMHGAEVLIHGSLEKYFKLTGIKSPSSIVVLSQTQTIAPTNATWAGDQLNGYYITGTLSEPGDLEILLNDYSNYGMGWIMNMNIGGEDLELESVVLEDAPVFSEDKVLTLKTTVEGYTLDITATCKAPIEISVTDATMAFSEEEWNAGALIISGTWQNEPVEASIYGWNFYGYNDYTDIQFNVGEDGELMWTNINASIKKQEDGSALLTSAFSYFSLSEGTIENYVLSIVIAEPIEPALEVIEVSANDMKFENEIFEEGTEWEWMQTTLTATCELGTISIALDLSLAGTTPENPYGEYGWGIVDNPMMGPMHVSTVDVKITPEAGEDEYVPEIYLSLKEGTVATYTAGEDVDTFIGEFVSETYELYTFHLTGAKQTSAVDNITTTVVPVKVIENGQLIIIKNGVKYNVAGAVVK